MLRRSKRVLFHAISISLYLYTSFAVPLILLGVFDPTALARFRWPVYLLLLAIVWVAVLSLVDRLLSGVVDLDRWRGQFLFVTVPITSILNSYIFVSVPAYSHIGLAATAAASMTIVGLAAWRTMAAAFFAFMSTSYALAWLFAGGPAWIRSPLWDGITGIALGVFFVALTLTSQFILHANEKIRSLLRDSRRDKRRIATEQEKADKLLLNILPLSIADELKRSGSTAPVHYASCSIMFTDFEGFTGIAAGMTPPELVAELDRCFSYFDSLMDRYGLEKLKTIGDSYMCAGGLPVPNSTHAIDCVLAGLEIQRFMTQMKEIKAAQGFPYWQLRLGIHSGPLVAGVIGEKKFTYDVWGDTVNTASRMESSGLPGRVNISAHTHAIVKDFFHSDYRGKVSAKGKGEIEMYFVVRIKPELSVNSEGLVPNVAFHDLRRALSGQPE